MAWPDEAGPATAVVRGPGLRLLPCSLPHSLQGATAAGMRVLAVPSLVCKDTYPSPDPTAPAGVVEVLPSLLAIRPQASAAHRARMRIWPHGVPARIPLERHQVHTRPAAFKAAARPARVPMPHGAYATRYDDATCTPHRLHAMCCSTFYAPILYAPRCIPLPCCIDGRAAPRQVYGLPAFSDVIHEIIPMPDPIRIRGEVVRGFGRGSKVWCGSAPHACMHLPMGGHGGGGGGGGCMHGPQGEPL